MLNLALLPTGPAGSACICICERRACTDFSPKRNTVSCHDVRGVSRQHQSKDRKESCRFSETRFELTSLPHEEATLSMPPYDLWLQGRASIAHWLSTFGSGCKGSRMIAVSACGETPAWAQYRDHGQTPWALRMIEMNHTDLTGYLLSKRGHVVSAIRVADDAY